jgi:hypothetical protein
VELTNTLPDSPDPKAIAVGLKVQQAFGRYPLPVIPHLGSDNCRFASYSYKSGLAAGMPVDICQAFLHHPEDGKLHIAWQSSYIGGNIERDGYAASFCQPLYVHGKGGCETAFVQ